MEPRQKMVARLIYMLCSCRLIDVFLVNYAITTFSKSEMSYLIWWVSAMSLDSCRYTLNSRGFVLFTPMHGLHRWICVDYISRDWLQREAIIRY